MADFEGKYLREITINLGPHDPAEATLVIVDASGQDALVPLRFFSDGRNKVKTVPIEAGNVHIDYRFNDYFYLDHLANIDTWSFEGLPGENLGVTLAIYIKRTGPVKDVVWPASFKWSGGAPLLSDTPGVIDLLILTSFDSGTTWLPDLARSYGP